MSGDGSPTAPIDFEPLRARLNLGVPFARHVGIEVIGIATETAAASLPERPELLNHVGSQHAGALFTAAEAASGAAMSAAFADRLAGFVPLVRRAEIRYVAVARGPVTATARLRDDAAAIRRALDADGRADFFVDVDLTDGQSRPVAHFSAEWAFRARRS